MVPWSRTSGRVRRAHLRVGRGRKGADAFQRLLLVCVVFSRFCRNSGSWTEDSALCTRKPRLREGRNSSQVTQLVSD